MVNNDLLSKTINSLRFPLIVGVVFIHNNMSIVNVQGMDVSYERTLWLNYIMIFLSDVLSTISVPLFFFFAGFLFFYKVDFTGEIYKKKLKNRCRTLLIPYLIWNFIGFIVLLIQMHPRFSSLFPLLENYRIDIVEFLKCFWMREYIYPINYPFWFIRELILLVIAAPVVYWFVRKLKVFGVILLGIVWFFQLGTYAGLSPLSHQSVFFFPLGAYFAVSQLDFAKLAYKAKWSPWIYIILAVSDMVTKGLPYNLGVHCLGILVGMIAVTYIASHLMDNPNRQPSEFLCNASFFVFAAHGLLVSRLMKILMVMVHPQSPYVILCIYFLDPLITIFLCLGVYKILKRYFPLITKVVAGGR